MSRLLVVRHGQASFLEADYDKLSEIGWEQSRALGAYWSRRGVAVDAVVVGPRVRHVDTAQGVGETVIAAGGTWPEAAVVEGLDEYEADVVIQKGLPELLEKDATIRKLNEDFLNADGPRDQHRKFQRMYEAVIGLWSRGELVLDGVESWATFCERTHAAWARILSEAGRGRTVAAFTSGGPIGIATTRAVGGTDAMALELAWQVRNVAVCEFVFSTEKCTMSSFNSLAHVEHEPRWLTYR